MAKSKKARRLDELAARIRVCTRSPLHESRTHAVLGDGSYDARVMTIGEAHGREVLSRRFGREGQGILRAAPARVEEAFSDES